MNGLTREEAKAVAARYGYFFLPCPFPGCANEFAGFELGGSIWYEEHKGIAVCPDHPDDYAPEDIGLPAGWRP